MALSQQDHLLAPRSPTGVETLQQALGALVAHYREDEVLTSVRRIGVREAKFRPMPPWVKRELAQAYRTKGIKELYSHQALLLSWCTLARTL